jgi:hypothetical protein
LTVLGTYIAVARERQGLKEEEFTGLYEDLEAVETGRNINPRIGTLWGIAKRLYPDDTNAQAKFVIGAVVLARL